MVDCMCVWLYSSLGSKVMEKATIVLGSKCANVYFFKFCIATCMPIIVCIVLSTDKASQGRLQYVLTTYVPPRRWDSISCVSTSKLDVDMQDTHHYVIFVCISSCDDCILVHVNVCAHVWKNRMCICTGWHVHMCVSVHAHQYVVTFTLLFFPHPVSSGDTSEAEGNDKIRFSASKRCMPNRLIHLALPSFLCVPYNATHNTCANILQWSFIHHFLVS